MRTKNLTLDVAKGIAIILVVYGHVIEHTMAPLAQDFFNNPVFKIIYTFHMPLFVFISGYLMAYSLGRQSPAQVFNGRCKSLLLPFITLSILGGLLTAALHEWSVQLLLQPQVWFLWMLFAACSLLIISVSLEKRLGLLSFALIYALLIFVPASDYFDLYFIKWFYPFYLAGYLLNRYGHLDKKAKGLMTVFFVVFLFGLAVPYWQKSDYIYLNKMHGDPGRLLYRYLVGFLGIILAFYLSAFLAKTKLGPWLGKIGTYSLDIYILQMLIVEGIYPRLVAKSHLSLDFQSPAVLYIYAPAAALFFTCLCLVVSKHILRNNGLLALWLLGGRGAPNKTIEIVKRDW